METENFKQQQQDRVEEGKELKREDELKDLSQIPAKNLPGAQNQSLLSKVSAGISNVAAGISNAAGAISEKVGLSEGPVEGHEELDRSVRRQVKKVNQEIHQYAAENGLAIEQVNDWENNALPKQVKKEVEGAAVKGGNNQSENVSQVEKQSLLSKIGAGISNTATNIVETVNPSVVEGHEELDRGVRRQVKKVNEEIRQYAVDNQLGPNKINDWENNSLPKQVKNQVEGAKNEAENIVKKSPFQPLTSGNNDGGENKTIGKKIKGGLKDASQKFSSTVGGATQKVKYTFVHKEANAEDKENAQQVV